MNRNRAKGHLLSAMLAEQDPTGLFPTLRAPPDPAHHGRLDLHGRVSLDSPFIHTYVIEALLPHHADPTVRSVLRRATKRLIEMGTPHPEFGLEWRFFDPALAAILPDADVLSRCLLVLHRAGGLGVGPASPLFAAGLRRVLHHTADLPAREAGAGHRVALTYLGERPDNDVDAIVNANLLLAARQIGWTDPLVDSIEAWLRSLLRTGRVGEAGLSGYYDRARMLPFVLSRVDAWGGAFAAERPLLLAAAGGGSGDPLDETLARAIEGQLGRPVAWSADQTRALTDGPVYTFFRQRTPWLVYGSRALQCALALQALDGRDGLRPALEV